MFTNFVFINFYQYISDISYSWMETSQYDLGNNND